MKTTKLSESKCPDCGYITDAATGEDASPAPGDYSVCFKCAGILVFDENLKVRSPTEKEILDAPSNLYDTQRLIQQYWDSQI